MAQGITCYTSSRSDQRETASKETDKLMEWKETVSKPVSTAGSDKVSSDPRSGHELTPIRRE